MQLFGLKVALQTLSTRELRTMFGSYNNKGWPVRHSSNDDGYRLMADAKNITLPKTPNPFAVIRNCLIEFDALRKDLLWQNSPRAKQSQALTCHTTV